ncbi:BamA/TamA family outer membrane protein [Trichothermofontia sichuanensis B231]|uniref:BamA/TamA family outer membrane protein n=1 Tax=Trichothermofontia sichuanensis TaxID=3045816 RepID=UPI0022472029|nr:BamA/TamA family outer membrane protein [Trichothermofontia sichuanensis]UZQ56125.1 BamA/TamA family outer membrane protein [Trichothermofontia sichuanensis B231]
MDRSGVRECWNTVKKTRLFSVLVATLAASASLGLSETAQGQTLVPTIGTTPSLPTVNPTTAETVHSVIGVVVPTRPEQSDSPQTVESTTVPVSVRFGDPLPQPFAPPPPQPQLLSQTAETRDSTPDTVTNAGTLPIVPPVAPIETVLEGTNIPDQATPDELELTPRQPPVPNVQMDLPTRPETSPEAEAPPPTPPAVQPPVGQPSPPADTSEPRVLVAEVQVEGATPTLQNEVFQAIRTQPGQTTTRSQLQSDINAIFATGYFARVRAEPIDTPLGVRITFFVEPNPALRVVQVANAKVLPPDVVERIFSPLYGQILNLRQLQGGIQELNKWYQENGYVLAQVVDAPEISPDGTVTLQVAEGVIADIQVQFLNKDGEATDEAGNPIKGRTRPFIITREFETKTGEVFNRRRIEDDLKRVFGLGIFEDVRLSLNPGENPQEVVVVVNVIERNTGSIAAGAGISSASGVFGSVSYQEQNLGGNNQKLGAEIQVGQRELLFDVNFTDPWIAGDPYRTSYTVNAFRRRSISLIFDGGDPEVELPNGDRPRVVRTGGGISFSRPLQNGWSASTGLQYQHVTIRDADGDLSPKDEKGNDLSFSGTGKDDLLTLQFGMVNDRRDNAIRPTQGSLLRFGVEQSVPVGNGSIFFNRLRGSYSFYVPVQYVNFAKGPQALAFNFQAGTVIGDLPPYEAFSLGGVNSVRGYDEGEVGSGRSFVQASAEYRFPLFSIVGGALFVDFASDLGTGDNVPGNPAGIRGKPGWGVGYGAGVRIQSPLGAIRIDYGLNNEGDSRVHFGIGERF